RKITEFGKYDWAKCVRKAVNAYKQSYHRAIGCAPIEIIEGMVLNYMDRQENIEVKINKEEYIEQARRNLKKYRAEYDTQSVGQQAKKEGIKVGDKVWYKLISMQRGKLEPKWLDKGIVLENKFNSFRIQLEDGRIVIASRNHVKPFKGEVV
ncbi:hypothetical protein NGRA_3635, partial [Nosema granulosis]